MFCIDQVHRAGGRDVTSTFFAGFVRCHGKLTKAALAGFVRLPWQAHKSCSKTTQASLVTVKQQGRQGQGDDDHEEERRGERSGQPDGPEAMR